ncbi:MAG: type I phosphomannose isomerase catalytic subunit [Planctomycetota bacterium]|jgi:mannose-6-phosphate isomerase
MTPYPLVFEPLLLPKVWGGRALGEYGKQLPPGERIGESWELADLPPDAGGTSSTVRNGALAGLTLRDLVAWHREAILGAATPTPDGGFPLLIKYLDARENLSVQVHPDAAWAARHPEAHLKSEAWVVVEADPGAVIYKGVRPGVTAEQFAADVEADRVVDDLVAVPVAPGDCHYLPSGICHALGAGVLVAEIQTPSDTTFRVYDWGRTDRDLHVAEAIACIDFDGTAADPAGVRLGGPPCEVGGVRTAQMVQTEHFAIERVDAVARTQFEIVTNGMPMVWMVVSGRGRLRAPSVPPVTLTPGLTVLLPAALERTDAVLEAGTWVLQVTLPPPTKGMLT